MNFGNMGCNGMWFIPLIICIGLFLIFGKGKKGFGPFGFFDNEKKDNAESSEALEVLKKRYASGELSKIEYDDIKKDLLRSK